MNKKESQKLQKCLMHIQSAEKIIRELLDKDVCKELQEANNELKTAYQQFIPERDRISAQLLNIGISSHLLGYSYIIDIVILYNEKKQKMMDMYEIVAKKNGTTAKAVERAIRNAVKSCWGKKEKDKNFELFGNLYSKRTGIPTNFEFIARLSQMLTNGEI